MAGSSQVNPPRRATPETRTWGAPQAAAVLRAAAGDEREVVWRLALLTGMRRGEILGLMWRDLDLDRGCLAVRRTLSRCRGGSWELGTPKSASGRRSIALPPSAVAGLERDRVRQLARQLALGEAWDDRGFVFDNGVGSPLHVNSRAARFGAPTAAAGALRIRFQDLRHTSATLPLARRVHAKVVQARLGHATVAMTLDRYSHVTMGMQREAADGLDAALGEAASSSRVTTV